MIAALLLLQAAAGTPQSFSILADPCVPTGDSEVVVCGRAPERLPPGADRGPPDGPTPSNPDLVPARALGTSCAGSMSGCGVGFNVFGPAVAAVRLVQKAINPDACCEGDQATNPFRLVGDAVKAAKGDKKVDRSGRVPIDLDAPPPSLAGRVGR